MVLVGVGRAARLVSGLEVGGEPLTATSDDEFATIELSTEKILRTLRLTDAAADR